MLPACKHQVKHILLHSAFPCSYTGSVLSTARHFLPYTYCFMWTVYLSYQITALNLFGEVLGPFENPIKDTNTFPKEKKKKTCTNTCNFVSSFRIRGCPEVHSQPFKECSFHTDNICLVYHGAQKIIKVPDTQKHNKCLFELSDWTLEGSGLQVSFRAISVASERS